jgi:hypothetical protein
VAGSRLLLTIALAAWGCATGRLLPTPVPDQLTALAGSVTTEPRPILECRRPRHLAYQPVLTNMFGPAAAAAKESRERVLRCSRSMGAAAQLARRIQPSRAARIAWCRFRRLVRAARSSSFHSLSGSRTDRTTVVRVFPFPG